jgi:hypothetical protein
MRLLAFLSLIGIAVSEYGCSSFAQLSHTANGCPANQGNPDCSFIQANAQQFCSTVATSWEIINGPNCNLRGASYGCIFASGLYSTTDQFCCPLIITGGAPAATASSAPTQSASFSPISTLTPSTSPAATVTPSSSASVTASVSFSPSASASVTTSPASSLSSTVSSYPSYTVTSSRTSYATVTATSTSTGTSTLTATPSFTPLPSTNITIIYQDKPILAGYNAAVGLSAIFGFCVLACCCFMIIGRKRPDQMNQLEPIQKQITLVERRASKVEKIVSSRRPSQAERRKSQLEVRVPEKIETSTV